MWLFGVEVGFVGFIISLFAMIWRGFDRQGGARRGAPLWLLAAVLCFALMCVALPRVPRPDHAVVAEAAVHNAQNKEP